MGDIRKEVPTHCSPPKKIKTVAFKRKQTDRNMAKRVFLSYFVHE
jgi:hypothetical protein